MIKKVIFCMVMEHVSKADPDIGDEEEDGATKEVDQHQVEPTLRDSSLTLFSI